MAALLVESVRSVSWIRRLIKQRGVDIVHSNTVAVLGGALAARMTRTAHVWHVHELIVSPRLMKIGFPRLVSALSDRIICISRMNAKWIIDEVPSARERVEVLWNGVERTSVPDLGAVEAYRDGLGASNDATVVITFVGRFNRWKGQQVLVDAMGVLWRRGHRLARVVFVGSAPPGEEFRLTSLQERIAASPAAGCMAVRPFTSDIWTVWDATDIAVVPSTDPEPFGLVAIEAMAAGKVVVASAHGGLLDIVEDGVTGVLVRPGDAEVLANALENLVNDRSLRMGMGARGRERQQRSFSLKSQVEALEKCYEQLL